MLQTTVGRVLTPPGAVPFVRQQLLQLVALMFKRDWLSGAGDASERLLSQATQLLEATESAPQALGLQLLLAALNEFSFTRLTAVGMTWEFHLQARYAFQQSSLPRFFRITVDWLRAWEARSGEEGEGAAAALEMASVVLHWNFQSKEAAAAAPTAGSVWATEQTAKDESLSPPASWRPALTGEGGLALLSVLFGGAARWRENPHLSRHYREALLGLARLDGGPIELWEDSATRMAWQQAAIGGTLSWLGALQEPAATGVEVRDACALLQRLLDSGGGSAREAISAWGADGAAAVGVIAAVCIRACALDDEGRSYASPADVRAAEEEWQHEAVRSALQVWCALISGCSPPRGTQEVASAVSQHSPSVLEAYLSWRLVWAVAEAAEAEGAEIEHEWEDAAAEREAEEGAEGEARLVGRLAQSCAAHALPLLGQLLQATAAAAGQAVSSAPALEAQLPALDLSRLGLQDTEAQCAARQEQLCSAIEVVASALTGRPRLTGALGTGGRSAVPADLGVAAASGPAGTAAVLGLVDALLTCVEAIFGQRDASPYTVETALEALRALCHVYCGVVPGSSVSHGLPSSLLEELAPPTHAQAVPRAAQRVERAIGSALTCIGHWGGTEPSVARSSSQLLLTLGHTPPLRAYLLGHSAGWVALHGAICGIGDSSASASAVSALAPGHLRCVVEALCRAGLATHADAAGAYGSKEGATYYAGIDASFGAALTSLASEGRQPLGPSLPFHLLIGAFSLQAGLAGGRRTGPIVRCYGFLEVAVVCAALLLRHQKLPQPLPSTAHGWPRCCLYCPLY